MNTNDFTTTTVVDQSADEVFKAINQPQQWWSGEFEGSTENLNNEFLYKYKDMHYSRQRVAELVTFERVVWEVIDSNLSFLANKQEWTGSKIVFDISTVQGKTQLVFTHQGVTPDVECYQACSNAWQLLIQQSLQDFIATGNADKPILV